MAIGHVGDTYLRREVDLNGLDADVLGAGRHGGGGVVYGWRGRRMETIQHRQGELRDRRERERETGGEKGKSLYKLKVLPGKYSRTTRKRRLLCTRIYSVRSVTVTIFFLAAVEQKAWSSFEPNNNDSSVGIKSGFRVWINS